jgi:UDP:flavonoid glycosyltransferase YjiC (YdhE family)
MINAYWSPYAKRREILPEIPLTSVIPPRWLGGVYRLSEPFTYRIHVGQMNRLRAEFGLRPIPIDLRYLYTEGDYVLYPDIPEFIPLTGAPPTHHFVGICEWTPPLDKPDWWPRMLADPRKKVFISLGSSGPVRILPALLKALSKLPVSVLISTSGRNLPPADMPAYVTNLLPFTETAAVTDVVVSHGGSGGLYPAMAAGTPVLGIPSNADQHLSTAILSDNGAGLGVRVEEASEPKLRATLEKLLFEPKYKESAKRWAEIYHRYQSPKMFQAFLQSVLP